VASEQTALELVALLERRQPGAGAGCARPGELLDWFTEDLDTKDLKKAKASLDELQATS
jgi:hypothetical protein